MRPRDPAAEEGTKRVPLAKEEKDPAKSGMRTDRGATDLGSEEWKTPPSPGEVREWRLRRPLKAAAGQGSIGGEEG